MQLTLLTLLAAVQNSQTVQNKLQEFQNQSHRQSISNSVVWNTQFNTSVAKHYQLIDTSLADRSQADLFKLALSTDTPIGLNIETYWNHTYAKVPESFPNSQTVGLILKEDLLKNFLGSQFRNQGALILVQNRLNFLNALKDLQGSQKEVLSLILQFQSIQFNLNIKSKLLSELQQLSKKALIQSQRHLLDQEQVYDIEIQILELQNAITTAQNAALSLRARLMAEKLDMSILKQELDHNTKSPDSTKSVSKDLDLKKIKEELFKVLSSFQKRIQSVQNFDLDSLMLIEKYRATELTEAMNYQNALPSLSLQASLESSLSSEQQYSFRNAEKSIGVYLTVPLQLGAYSQIRSSAKVSENNARLSRQIQESYRETFAQRLKFQADTIETNTMRSLSRIELKEKRYLEALKQFKIGRINSFNFVSYLQSYLNSQIEIFDVLENFYEFEVDLEIFEKGQELI